MKNKYRVTVYVDGFNLYHPIHQLNKPHLKWFNLYSYAEGLCRSNETLVAVNYFSAYARWIPSAYARHQEYVKALQWAGCTFHEGQFKEKRKTCKACGVKYKAHEEKETDVNIAVQLVTDAFDDVFDRAIIISADSDLLPPIRKVCERFCAKRVLVVAPPNQFSAARSLGPKLTVTPGKLAKNLLPEFADNAEGKRIFTRPENYKLRTENGEDA